MADQEALIRAIVENPGDDVPRLVYADWLDERADARGAYLRAEAAAFRIARDSEPFSQAIDDLQALTRSFDPIWLARLSRPPVGVCLDQIRFEERGVGLSVASVLAAEARLQLRLPEQFRAFLLNYNGQKPEFCSFLAPSRNGLWPESVQTFVRLGRSGRVPEEPEWSWEFEAATRSFNDSTTEPPHFAVLLTVHYLKVVAVGLIGKRRDRVNLFSRYTIRQSLPPRLITTSLSRFFARLLPDVKWTSVATSDLERMARY